MNPLPSLPSIQSLETLTFSRTTSLVGQPIIPILFSALPKDTPSSLESTTKVDIPLTPNSGLVLAKTIT